MKYPLSIPLTRILLIKLLINPYITEIFIFCKNFYKFENLVIVTYDNHDYFNSFLEQPKSH